MRSLAATFAVFRGSGALVEGVYLMRFILKAESSGSLRLQDAVEATGEVYLTVPSEGQGSGLVHFPLQRRSVELEAVTREKDPLTLPAARVYSWRTSPSTGRCHVARESLLRLRVLQGRMLRRRLLLTLCPGERRCGNGR